MTKRLSPKPPPPTSRVIKKWFKTYPKDRVENDDDPPIQDEPELTRKGTPKRRRYADVMRRKWKTPEQVMHDERKRIFIGQILHMAGRMKKKKEQEEAEIEAIVDLSPVSPTLSPVPVIDGDSDTPIQ